MLRYREIKNMLLTEIGKMNSNDRLPSRTELCKRLETTRMTLDKAMNELVAEGTLFSRKGSGTYVADANGQLPVHKGNWAVIVRDVRRAFYADIVRGVENVAQSYGINVILCNSDCDFDKQEQYIKRLSHSDVSGLIIVPILSQDPRENGRLYSQLAELKVPCVFCNRNGDWLNAPVVTSNDFYGGYIAAKHLLEKGYRNIAYIANRKFRTSVDRCQGYISALMEQGIEVDREIILIEDQDDAPLFGLEMMKKILVLGHKVDGVFCFSNKITQQVYQAIVEAGLRVSDDIGVVGYDDLDICEKLTPAVTSIAYKNLEVGTKAAEVLYKKINKENMSGFELYLFKPELVVRDSCLGPKTRYEFSF
jgi:DNA-binding LacI/PurR family transcriptional regulator